MMNNTQLAIGNIIDEVFQVKLEQLITMCKDLA